MLRYRDNRLVKFSRYDKLTLTPTRRENKEVLRIGIPGLDFNELIVTEVTRKELVGNHFSKVLTGEYFFMRYFAAV